MRTQDAILRAEMNHERRQEIDSPDWMLQNVRSEEYVCLAATDSRGERKALALRLVWEVHRRTVAYVSHVAEACLHRRRVCLNRFSIDVRASILGLKAHSKAQ